MSSSFTAALPGCKSVARRCAPLLLLACIVAGPGAFAAEPLTLADAQRRAVERSRQLASQDFSVAASREMGVAAGQLPDPVLQLGVDNLPVNGPDRFSLTNDFMTMRRVGVMQELTRRAKRSLRSERYEREAQKKLAEKEVTVAAIERDTALAWLDAYYAQAMAAVVDEQGRQAEMEVQAAEGSYRAGRGSQADLLAARSALASFDDRRSEVKRRLSSARIMLARWIGDAAQGPLSGKPDIAAIRLDPATLETQLDHHPEIAVLQRQEELARSEARLADANRKPDWSVELMYQQRGPSFSNMVSVGVSVPLQWDRKNRQDRELSAKLALVEQATAEREEMLRSHTAEVRVMIDEWTSDRERLARYERELSPLANGRIEATLAAYRGGKSSLAEVLAARRNALDVRLQALQLETEAARLWARINFFFPGTAAANHNMMPLEVKQ